MICLKEFRCPGFGLRRKNMSYKPCVNVVGKVTETIVPALEAEVPDVGAAVGFMIGRD